MKPQLISLVFFTFMMGRSGAQNSISLQLEDGAPFQVLLNDKIYNKSPQSQVLITGLKQDTVHLKVVLEKGERYGVTFYLLEKGKPTSQKEFTYLLKKEKQRLRPVFMGAYDFQGVKRAEEDK